MTITNSNLNPFYKDHDVRGGGLGFGIRNTHEKHADDGIAASSKDDDSIEFVELVDFLLSNTAA